METIHQQVRQSLGLAAKPVLAPTFPVEGHICDFPLWSFSKKRSTITQLHVIYEDKTFFLLEASRGLPSISSPGYLDVLLHFGQRDLFSQNYVEMSAYAILKQLHLDPQHGGNYRNFVRDMERNFALFLKTDRFIDPVTKRRSHITYFRVLDTMQLARHRKGVSRFYFNQIFLESLRAGYLKRLDLDFCLHLDRGNEALARFLYAHLLKRIGRKSVYTRNLTGFLNDIGLGYVAQQPAMRRNQTLKRTVYPALDRISKEAFRQYELDDQGNLLFFPKD